MFRSSVMDDLIGTESGDTMSSNVEGLQGVPLDQPQPRNNRSRMRYRISATTRQYPQLIPLFSEAGNFPAGRMPWVFKRKCADGRLTLRAERVKHHEVLEAQRENGKLIMKLVPVDDIVYCDECCGDAIREDEEEEREDVEFNEEREEEREECSDDLEEELASEGSLFRLETKTEQCGTPYYVSGRFRIRKSSGKVKELELPIWAEQSPLLFGPLLLGCN